jgi:hemin uptake protein HemP
VIDDTARADKTHDSKIGGTIVSRMTDDADDGGRTATARAGAPRTVSSRDLLGEDKFVIIRHEDEVYRLQRTAAGKLILTK